MCLILDVHFDEDSGIEFDGGLLSTDLHISDIKGIPTSHKFNLTLFTTIFLQEGLPFLAKKPILKLFASFPYAM
jgi:hypothetical protein